MMQDTAKVFMSGNSQAIRLPKKYRIDADEVFIKQEGTTIVFSPKSHHPLADFFAKYPPLPPDFDFDPVRDRQPDQIRELF
ncbi:MAG: AbrB/MazE/SpoVT family DNA-binding domain-containing protein [Rickettsiales bacterium]|jgi:antitoxin VapB|nr:AbrB/MazE/SpoVT family DNA-binding domain-containing protein [Rickettsiales bacterium]